MPAPKIERYGKPRQGKGLSIDEGLPAEGRPIAPLDIAAAINDLFDRHGKLPAAVPKACEAWLRRPNRLFDPCVLVSS
jgi:hypothetical protein